MRIAGQWLAWRLKRRLLDAVDRCDLVAIEHRYRDSGRYCRDIGAATSRPVRSEEHRSTRRAPS
jgi:hypothetical protein